MKRKVFRIPFKGYFTRAYTFGDFKNKTPIIIMHGGPGGCVERYEPLEKLADFGIPLIFYDQLGCGYSKVPKNSKICWNFQLFLDEFDNLVKYFKLQNFIILGHSWGGMLALEWATRRDSKGLQKLILFSTLPSTKIWNEEHIKMIENFPEEEIKAIIDDFNGKQVDKKVLKSGIKRFYRSHIGKKSTEFYKFNRKVFPKNNREIYEKMWGKSELFGTGTLKDWNVEDKLHLIDTPTLIISGAYDESSPRMNKLMNDRIKNSKWELLKNSHHIGYAEENKLVVSIIKDFVL